MMAENTAISGLLANKTKLFSLLGWHVKSNPSTKYRNEEYEILIADTYLFFKFKVQLFGVNFARI